MVTSGLSGLEVWKGIASYDGTLYRVAVIAGKECWKSDIVKVVSRAGGYLRTVERSESLTDLADRVTNDIFPGHATYKVSFTPDPAITTGALGRKPVTVLLRSDYSRITPRDGELQSPPRSFLNPQRPSYAQPRPLGGRRYP